MIKKAKQSLKHNAPIEALNEKCLWPAGALLAPVPVVMLSCRGTPEAHPNIITVAWVGTLCSNPPMLGVGIAPARYSHRLILESGEFVVNIPSRRELFAVDFCGVVSGREHDKFAETGLTPSQAQYVQAPVIAECPINIECKVRQTVQLGSHTLFIAEILGEQINRKLIDSENRLAIDKAGLVAFAHGTYFELGRPVGKFGFSVKKK